MRGPHHGLDAEGFGAGARRGAHAGVQGRIGEDLDRSRDQAVAITGDTGYFWFFNGDNVELVLKVLDGRSINGHYWVFYGALSSVQYTITVTDTETQTSKVYTNPQGTLASVADTEAF